MVSAGSCPGSLLAAWNTLPRGNHQPGGCGEMGREVDMLAYKAAYKLVEGIYLGEVLDFPGTVSFGGTLEEARSNLSAALFDMAETNLLRGEPLPLPNPACTDPDADLEEPLYLVIQTGPYLSVSVSSGAPGNAAT